MRFAHFFIDRPIFAAVVSIFIVLLGGIAYLALPAAQYPDVVPPTIVVRAVYPGASPEVIAETVATPIEQEVNGVENMLYMSSQTTTDGQMTLTITFKLGTDLDTAQVLVQNRVAIAEPRLPEDVRRLGITTLKSSPDILMVIHIVSPDKRYDQLYIGNYALIQIRDALARVDGVGDVTPFGLREYSMRAWLDPERLCASFADAWRRGSLAARAKPASRLGRHRPAADSQRRPISAFDQYAGPAAQPGAVWKHHPQDRRRWPRHQGPRRRRRSSWARATTPSTAI